MSLGIGLLLAGAWKPNQFNVGEVEVIPANFGTAGSLADYRRRRFDVVVAPPEPRKRAFNGLLPVVWRLRVNDTAKTAAVATMTTRSLGTSVNYTPPRTASLLKGQ